MRIVKFLVLLLLAFLFFAYEGCDRKARDLSAEIVESSRWEDVVHYAVIKSQEQLTRAPELLVRLGETEIKQLEADLLQQLSTDRRLIREGILVADAKIGLDRQALGIHLSADVYRSAVQAHFNAVVGVAVRSERTVLIFDPHIQTFNLEQLRVHDEDISAVRVTVNKLIDILLSQVGAAMRVLIEPLFTRIREPTISLGSFGQLSDGEVSRNERAVSSGASIADLAILIDENGLYGIASVASRPVAQEIQPVRRDRPGINDEPSGFDRGIATPQDFPYVFSSHDFRMEDPADADPHGDNTVHALAAIKITTLPKQGKLIRRGVDVSPGDFVSVAELTRGWFYYLPPVRVAGPRVTQFRFQVRDAGGIDSGGIDLDQTPNTLYIDMLESRSNYPDVSEAELKKRFSSFQKAYLNVLSSTFGETARSTYHIVLTKPYISAGINEFISESPISGVLRIENLNPEKGSTYKEFREPFMLASAQDLQCARKYDSCRFVDICKNRDACQQSVTKTGSRTVSDICRVSCCLESGFLGCVVSGFCDEPCDRVEQYTYEVLEPTRSSVCEAYSKVDPQTCVVANTVGKAECDLRRGLKIRGCQSEQGLSDLLAKNPIADVEGRYRVSGSLDVSLDQTSTNPALTAFVSRISARGSARIDAGLTFSPRGEEIFGVSCGPSWDNSFEADVSLDVQSRLLRFNFVEVRRQNDDSIEVRYEMPGEKDLDVTLAQSPLDVFLSATRGSRISCDRAGEPLALLELDFALAPFLVGIHELNEGPKFKQPLQADLGMRIKADTVEIGTTRYVRIPHWGEQSLGYVLAPHKEVAAEN